ncbi:hypothetical protein [Nostoc sp. 106C]|uniref:DUF7219 family protein n=1 Tax=Nostoc sp. 106C TaxID=1932667 RepID=UPI000A39A490|nr:hypothetical protein [Nostoc sp. 106C]OUL18636.1 hypothetical protein BV375_33790 [Nostoc sp. 106C]
MKQESDFLSELCDFLYPRDSYYSKFKPDDLVFNNNLQEFSQRVSYICSLQTGGKLSPEEAYQQIHLLWKKLKRTKKELESLNKENSK